MTAFDPKTLKFSKEHEWVQVEGKICTMGITEYAAEQLGDVVHVDLPEVEGDFAKDTAFGVVESVKSVSDIFVPVSAKVTEVNLHLQENPELVNEDPYGEGWICKLEISDESELNELMDHEGYQSFLSEEA